MPEQNPIEIETQFWAFLKRVYPNMEHEQMPKDQLRQLRGAFYGGFSSLLVLMREIIPEMPEEQGIGVLESLFIQCETHWIRELQRRSSQNN